MQPFSNLDLKDRRVLLRADLNVPVKNGHIEDYSRIRRLKPTIELLKKMGARIVLASHFGRPEGKIDPAYSLRFMVHELAAIYNCNVTFAPDIMGGAISPGPGEIVLLENLRFHAGEEANDDVFAKQLASWGDVYINDAFACSHRSHASIVAVTRFLPKYSGLLLLEEVNNLQVLLNKDTKPLMAIIGGKKVSTKFKVLNFMDACSDYLVICGAMANTLLAAQGYNIQASYYEPELLEASREFMKNAKSKIILPTDVVVANQQNHTSIRDTNSLQEGESIFDMGIDSCMNIMQLLEGCATVLWNGPLGMFEDIRFRASTDMVARKISVLTLSNKLKSIAGGGDTVSALEQSGMAANLSYISTAGGAFLEWLESGTLPGLEALNQ